MSVIISGSTDIGYKVNTNNLLLYLDAGNPNSYPGTGTTWFDLSSKVNNSNIPASTVYTNASSSFYTNGTIGSFIRFDVPQLNTSTNVITVELVYKWEQKNSGAYDIVFGFQLYNLMIAGTAFSYNTGNGVFQSANGFAAQVGNWYHLVCEMYQFPPTFKDGNNKLWINGVNQTLTNGGGTTVDQDFNGGAGRIGDAIGWGALNYNTIGYYSIFKMYDRVLSQQEITDNYKHYKTRYPLS